SRRRLQVAGQLATLFNLAKRAALQDPTPTDEVITQLADLDVETAHQIRRFLVDVARDHRLVEDLTPDAMSNLNRNLRGTDAVPLASFVSVAPRTIISPWAFVATPVQRLLYDVTSRLAADAPPQGVHLPEAPWIGGRHRALTPTSNDGIVP